MAKTLEEKVDIVIRELKKQRGVIQELWDRLNTDDEAHGIMEDETREMAERARRAVLRFEKKLEALEDVSDGSD